MNLKEAHSVLGLPYGPIYGSDEVRFAYSRAIRDAHPDTSGPDANIAYTIESIKRARTALLAALAGQPTSHCPVCRGSGKVRVTGKLMTVNCPRGCDPD